MVSAASQLPGVPVRASEDRLYFHMAIVAAVVAFAGFAPTYWLPLMAGTQAAPPIIHVHAVAFFGWVLFFVVQTWLAANRRIAKHRSMGMIAISLATAMVLLGILTSIERMYAAAAIGKTAAGLEFSIVPLGSILLFAIIFAAAVTNVRRTDWHKRLMLVAAITILDAPIARWFLTFLAPADAPPGPPPVAVDVAPSLVALGLLSIPMIADWRRRGSVHPAFWIGASAYLAWKLVQVPLSATPQWHTVAEWIMRLGGQS